jgi:hypothetical protein
VFILSAAAAAKRKEKVETNEKVRLSDKELKKYYFLPACVSAIVSCGKGLILGLEHRGINILRGPLFFVLAPTKTSLIIWVDKPAPAILC